MKSHFAVGMFVLTVNTLFFNFRADQVTLIVNKMAVNSIDDILGKNRMISHINQTRISPSLSLVAVAEDLCRDGLTPSYIR